MTAVREVWIDAPGRVARLGARVRNSARARLHPALRAWTAAARALGAPVDAPGGPSFAIGGPHPAFAELEAIFADPAVLGAIETPPVAALSGATLPPARLPLGAAAFGAPARRTPARIVDIFPVGLELDLLELRLLQLYDVVDRFIAIESPRGFGGPAKPLFLQRNLRRFDRFRDKLVPLVLDDGVAADVLSGRRTPTDFGAEAAMRTAAWTLARDHIGDERDAIVLWSDLDEFPSRDVVHWIAHHDVELPLRLRAPTLRYRFGLRDPETVADIVVFAPSRLGGVAGASLRDLPGRRLRSRGTVHLTSFLPPLALVAKFAMTTDWEPEILPFLRNGRNETARMIADGRWFERRLTRYNTADPDGLIPQAAQLNRQRFARFWDEASGPQS